jgi:hypothetical protein
LVRTGQLEAVLTEAARYIDPRADTVGTVLAARPGSRVVRTTAADEHHGLARFGFRVIGADGSELLRGVDVVELTPDDRIARIIGFFGNLTLG